MNLHPFHWLRSIYGGLPDVEDYGLGILKLVIFLALLALGWWIVNKLTTEFNDHEEIVEERNVRFILVRAAMLLGQGVATLPLVGAKSDDTRTDLLWLTFGGLGIIAVFNIIRPILDLMLSGHRRSANDLREITLAGAIIQAAFYVADGLIISGALSGSAPSATTGALATGVFILLGFGTLVLAYLFAGKLYALNRKVKDDNAAAALILGPTIVGLGFILRAAIAGDFTGWASGIVGFLVAGLTGVIVLVVLMPVLDKLILGKLSVREMTDSHHWPAAITMGSIIVTAAVGLAAITV